MAIILFVIAISLSAIAAFYAVSGLVAIFASAAIPIAIMGGVLEAGKLVVASWLYRRWNDINFLMKTYFTTALIVLMLLTSMGIFGFLSKSHLDQAGEKGVNDIRIEQIERQIARENKSIADAELVLSQLDKSVQVLIDYDRIRGKDGAIAVRESQKPEREELTAIISESSDKIAALENERNPLLREKLDLELEIGPLKYIAEFIYGDEASSHFDEAVRWVILAIIFVFDPLAVMLLIAWNREVTMTGRKEKSDLPDFSMEDYEAARFKMGLENVSEVSEPRPVKEKKKKEKLGKKKQPQNPVNQLPKDDNNVSQNSTRASRPAAVSQTEHVEENVQLSQEIIGQSEDAPEDQEITPTYQSDVQERVYKPVHGRPDRLKK